MHNLVKSFGALVALNQVSLELSEGVIYGLIGPNGCGKSTLLNVVNGIFKPDSGRVFFQDTDISGKRPHIIAKMGIGRTFQTPRIFPDLTVEENLIVATALKNTQSEDFLNMFELSPIRKTKAGNLGYAQRKLLELARALSFNPKIVMLDEPMSGLDLKTIEMMSKYIRLLNKSYGKTLLIVEHNLEELMSLADYIFVFNNGIKIEEGKSDFIKKSGIVMQVYFGG